LQETFVRFEKAFGETGAVKIVIRKAPWTGSYCFAWRGSGACILQLFDGEQHANYNLFVGWPA